MAAVTDIASNSKTDSLSSDSSVMNGIMKGEEVMARKLLRCNLPFRVSSVNIDDDNRTEGTKQEALRVIESGHEFFQTELPAFESEDFFKESTKEFRLFPGLPYDVRLLIWEACFPPARRVVVKVYTNNAKGNMRREPNPPTLFVNKESRELTRKAYKPLFRFNYDLLKRAAAGEYGYWRAVGYKPRQYYFSPSKDTLVFLNSEWNPACYEFQSMSRWSNESSVCLRKKHIQNIELRNYSNTYIRKNARCDEIRTYVVRPLLRYHNLQNVTLRTRQYRWFNSQPGMAQLRDEMGVEETLEHLNKAYTELNLPSKRGNYRIIPNFEVVLHPRIEMETPPQTERPLWKQELLTEKRKEWRKRQDWYCSSCDEW